MQTKRKIMQLTAGLALAAGASTMGASSSHAYQLAYDTRGYPVAIMAPSGSGWWGNPSSSPCEACSSR